MSSFDIFWATYPRRVGKGAASRAWNKALTRGVAPEDIIDGARRYDEDPMRLRKDVSFTAHPATWINQERWLDEAPLPLPEPVDLARRWENDPDPEYPTAMQLFPHIRKPESYDEPHVCSIPALRRRKVTDGSS